MWSEFLFGSDAIQSVSKTCLEIVLDDETEAVKHWLQIVLNGQITDSKKLQVKVEKSLKRLCTKDSRVIETIEGDLSALKSLHLENTEMSGKVISSILEKARNLNTLKSGYNEQVNYLKFLSASTISVVQENTTEQIVKVIPQTLPCLTSLVLHHQESKNTLEFDFEALNLKQSAAFNFLFFKPLEQEIENQARYPLFSFFSTRDRKSFGCVNHACNKLEKEMDEVLSTTLHWQ